jgi:UDP-glucose/GDP-mannose dehydrogenase family, NAD binding domain
MIKNLSMIGLGKLGAPLAACWSAKGFRVIAVDVDARKVEAIKRGVSPILEPGVDKLPLCATIYGPIHDAHVDTDRGMGPLQRCPSDFLIQVIARDECLPDAHLAFAGWSIDVAVGHCHPDRDL